MPELPEVETVRRGLNKLILDVPIKKVEVIYSKLIVGDAKQFARKIKGAVFTEIDRRGKYLLLRLDTQQTIVSHLRMEGQYSVEPDDTPPHKHTELALYLKDGRVIFYNDTRRFGRMQLVDSNQLETVTGLNQLGPEPTAKTFKLTYFSDQLSRSRQAIKPFLLDQTHVAGIGNIYADEVLWLSKIHPLTSANQLTPKQVELLRTNIIDELKLATKHHGTTVHSFSNVFGKTGEFQNELHVYGRAGQPCERCGTLIKKIRVAQRGTSFCPKCQKLIEGA